jgi:hypothetical protein
VAAALSPPTVVGGDRSLWLAPTTEGAEELALAAGDLPRPVGLARGGYLPRQAALVVMLAAGAPALCRVRPR